MVLGDPYERVIQHLPTPNLGWRPSLRTTALNARKKGGAAILSYEINWGPCLTKIT